MKDKIISKAKEMFLKLGFKSITMDDIACEMCISKKTIYKYFANKDILIEESVLMVHEEVRETTNPKSLHPHGLDSLTDDSLDNESCSEQEAYSLREYLDTQKKRHPTLASQSPF